MKLNKHKLMQERLKPHRTTRVKVKHKTGKRIKFSDYPVDSKYIGIKVPPPVYDGLASDEQFGLDYYHELKEWERFTLDTINVEQEYYSYYEDKFEQDDFPVSGRFPNAPSKQCKFTGKSFTWDLGESYTNSIYMIRYCERAARKQHKYDKVASKFRAVAGSNATIESSVNFFFDSNRLPVFYMRRGDFTPDEHGVIIDNPRRRSWEVTPVNKPLTSDQQDFHDLAGYVHVENFDIFAGPLKDWTITLNLINPDVIERDTPGAPNICRCYSYNPKGLPITPEIRKLIDNPRNRTQSNDSRTGRYQIQPRNLTFQCVHGTNFSQRYTIVMERRELMNANDVYRYVEVDKFQASAECVNYILTKSTQTVDPYGYYKRYHHDDTLIYEIKTVDLMDYYARTLTRNTQDTQGTRVQVKVLRKETFGEYFAGKQRYLWPCTISKKKSPSKAELRELVNQSS